MLSVLLLQTATSETHKWPHMKSDFLSSVTSEKFQHTHSYHLPAWCAVQQRGANWVYKQSTNSSCGYGGYETLQSELLKAGQQSSTDPKLQESRLWLTDVAPVDRIPCQSALEGRGAQERWQSWGNTAQACRGDIRKDKPQLDLRLQGTRIQSWCYTPLKRPTTKDSGTTAEHSN